MTGSEWLAAMPEMPGDARDAHVLSGVRDGTIKSEFVPLKCLWHWHKATLSVSGDALFVELDDGSRYRPPMSARLTQQVADLCGCTMMTELIDDIAYDQATVLLEPQLMSYGPEMCTKSHSITYNEKIEKLRKGRTGLVRNVGKIWALTHRILSRPNAAANYGWHVVGATFRGVKTYESHHGSRVIQPLATAHDTAHVDSSQVTCLIGGTCVVDGEVMPTVDVMRSAELCGLLSYEESFPVRMPGVEELTA